MSSVRARDVRIAQAQLAGFAAYLDEAGYKPATIQASGVIFEDPSVQALVQTGSSVTIGARAFAEKRTPAWKSR